MDNKHVFGFFLLLGFSSKLRANPIQLQILHAGINLGFAKARIQFIGVSDEGNILADLTRAGNAIRNAGAGLAQFYNPPQKRIQERERILRYISDYANFTQGRSAVDY